MRGVVDEVRGTARQLHDQSVAIAAIRAKLVAHEEIAHKLLSSESVNRTGFVRQQHQVSALFQAALPLFPATGSMRSTFVTAERSWQSGLTAYGLWSTEVSALHGNHEAENPTYGASSDHTVAILDSLEGPSLDAMNAGLDHGGNLERLLVVGLAGVFVFALAVTLYFRRRMTKDLVRPIVSLHRGVASLQAGEYGHRIEIARRDELGELAEAFNEMASALHDSHLALTRRATHDSLTGLPNRASLIERLTLSFGPVGERRRRRESLLFIDIDDFKDVNDSLGHEGGDALLVQLAGRLNDCVRPIDLVARLGGDEFAIALAGDEGESTAGDVAGRILEALRKPFLVGNTTLVVAVSIGIAEQREETCDAAELLRNADFAMYMAKGAGKGRYQLFDPQMHQDMVGRADMKAGLPAAAASGQLRLDYQPVVDLQTGEVLGVEALVRWQHPTLGLLAPCEFIPLAEETGDIDVIGCWVLDEAARRVAGWRNSMDHCTGLWVSVNLSALQLRTADGVNSLRHILADPRVQAEHVILEITESALASDVDGAIAALNTLKASGARIAIDDFGTGFSSLSTLARLPVDILKIDRSFVSGGQSTVPSVAMLEGILGLANRLSLGLIAEGIEEPEQLELLRTLGCRMGQGYLLRRPVSAHALEALLAAGGMVEIVEPVT